ncbi:hypothetical protein KU6B_12060 [Mameliella alba]|nr:hypothetical protein KU6B_12060 [Mameliella alba]
MVRREAIALARATSAPTSGAPVGACFGGACGIGCEAGGAGCAGAVAGSGREGRGGALTRPIAAAAISLGEGPDLDLGAEGLDGLVGAGCGAACPPPPPR